MSRLRRARMLERQWRRWEEEGDDEGGRKPLPSFSRDLAPGPCVHDAAVETYARHATSTLTKSGTQHDVLYFWKDIRRCEGSRFY